MGGRADNEHAGELATWVDERRWGLQREVSGSCAGSRGWWWSGLMIVSTLLCFCPARGSRATQSLCSGTEGSLLGVASDVTGHEQRRRRREVCMGLADIGPEAGQPTTSDPLCPSVGLQSPPCVHLP